MLSNSLKILFFTIFTLIVQTTFAASDKSKENLEQEKRITKTIQTLGYFTQIAKSFKHRNNQNATDINQIYEHASGILKDGIYLERNDPWGDKWIFEVKNGVFKVDSINYKKYRETQALAAENIIKDPYADSNFGAELAATQTIFASDEETDKPRKRNRRRGQQYDCEGLLIENNQISTDCRRIFFEKGAKFAEQISATKYYSNDNFVETVSFLPTFSAHYSGDKYELDFSENSEIEILNIAKIADSESDEFALDPTEITTLNELTVEKLKDFSGENLKNLIANSVNNSIVVTLRTLPDLAVVRGDTLDSGGNIKLVIDGRDSNIGSVLVGTTDSQTYQSFSTSGDLSADSIQVGTITNTFNTGEHSLLVGGDIAVRGDIYTNEQLTISGQTITDEITSSGAIKIQTGNVNFVNSIDDSGVNISTDSGANLNISASQISFKANRNKADGYRFNNASGEAVFAIDTQNQRVGIGEISTATLTVANGGIVNVNSLGVDSPLTINTTAKGKLLPLEFNGQDISWYGVIGDGAPTISDAGIGSLAFESGTGSLYVKNPAAWQLLPLDQDSIHNGGDNTTATLFVGTNDNNALEIITNNEIALKLDADQNASFFGNISLNNKNISGVSELKISTLKPQNGTLTISLKDAQTNALRITDGSTDLLNFNTNAGAKSITVGADLKLGGNQISGSNFDINGGRISGVRIGSITPLTSLSVGRLTFSGNAITSSTGEISFGDENLSTTGEFTFSTPITSSNTLDFSGGNLTNAGEVTLSSIGPQTGSNLTINLSADQPEALVIKQETDKYLTFDTRAKNITVGKNLVLGDKNISGSSFTITGSTIDNTEIGNTTPAAATFTSLGFTTLSKKADLGNQKLTNVNIDSGAIDITEISAISLKVGNLIFSDNSINVTSNPIDFGNNNLTANTFAGGINLDGGAIVNVDNVSLDDISARVNTIDIMLKNTQAAALKIAQGSNDFLTFDTENEKILLGQNIDFAMKNAENIKMTSGTINGVAIGATSPAAAKFTDLAFDTLTSGANLNNQELTNVNIDSGNISVSSINAISLKVDEITIAGNQITSSNGTINFADENLTTSGAISANSLTVPTISGVSSFSVDNILANSGGSIAIGVDGNAINLAADALKIEGGNVSTAGDLTVGTTFTADTVAITGGAIDGVAIGANVAATSLKVGMFSIGGNSIISDNNMINLGANDISNASVNPANLRYSGTPNFANIGDLSLNSISANGGNINIGAAGNSINLATDALQIATDKNITLGGNLTVNGTLNANAVAITGGTIGGVTVAATTLTVDDISIDGNQITSTHADGISFADENLATSGAINAGSLSAPTISGVDEITLDNILANSGGSIAIGVDGNAINLAGSAITVSGGNVATAGDLTVGTTFTADTVDINGGTIDGVTIGATTPATSLKVGMFSIGDNRIISDNNMINLGANDISNASVDPAHLRYSDNPNFTNIGNLSLNSITANTDNINIGTTGNTINLAGDALQIAADKSITLSNNLTVTGGTLTANAVAITGGMLAGVDITATTLTVDDITIDNGNQITSSHANGISFVDENLTTSGAINANSLSAPTISGVSSFSVDNILANSGGSIAIGVDGNAINLAGSALTVSGGNVATAGDLTVGTTFTADTVAITGGTIDGVAIGADVAATSLKVGMFSIGGNRIISDNNMINLGANDISNASVNPANLTYAGTPNFANINNLSLNSITANGTNINIGVAGNSINLATDALQIAADKNITLSNNLTVTAGTLNANAVAITGGTIGGVTVAATTLKVDEITIDGNQITSSNGTINFADENLTTSGAINAGSLSAPTISGVSSFSVDNILANSGGSIAIGVDGNAINLAGSALTVSGGNVATAGDLTVGTTFTADTVAITGGTIDGVAIGANAAATSLKVGMFSIGGNRIISDNNMINLGANDISNASVNPANLRYSGTPNFANIGNLSLNSISANGGNINIGANGNSINIATDALQIDGSKNITLGGNLTVNAGNLNANAVAITGGTLAGVDITATTLTVDEITIDGNTITSSTGGISFADEALTTSGAITANSLTAPTISGVDEITLDNILAKTDNSIAIGVDGNAINLAADALKIEGGNVTTKANLTVGGTFNAGTVAITGGTIDNVAINATSLTVDNIIIDGNSITAVSGGNIDFGAATLTTTGSISANGFDANEQNISNVGEISLDSIAADQNIAINASGEVNIQSGKLVINATNVTVNNTLDINTTELTKITFGGSPTGVIAINNDNQYALMNASDRRVKQNIQNTRHNASNILNAFRVVDFRYIAHPTSNLITGFIAQEAREIYPAMVSELKKDLLGISSSTLIPILVKGFQEQQTDINSLTAAIEVNQNDININKNLKIHSKTLVDEQNNLYANSLKLESNIELENDEFSIKRSDRMGNLMSVRTAKIMDENAQGYLSVKDIYLADKTVWMSQIKNKIETFSGPNSSTCGTENLGSARISNSGEVFVCLGSKGWKIIKS